MADCTGSTGDEHNPAGERGRMQLVWSVFGHRQRAVRGDRRNTHAGPLIEARARGQSEDALGGQHCLFLTRATVRALVGGESKPHAVADADMLHVIADCFNNAGTILAGNNLTKGQCLTGCRTAP